MKPRNLKQAIENGYMISKIDFKSYKILRVTVVQRFGIKSYQYWYDRDTFKRNYPSKYAAL